MSSPSPIQAADLGAINELLGKYPFLFGAGDTRDQKKVAEVVERYLAHAPDELTKRALETRRHHLAQFIESFGQRRVSECTPLELKEWIMSRPNVKSGWTRQNLNVSVQRAFNFAVEQRLIRENPVRGLKLRLEKKVGRDIKPDEFQAVLRHTDAHFRRFLIALKLTGARPGELAALEWHHIDWGRGVAVLPQHKTAHKTGKPRTLVFVPQMMKLLSIIKRDQHSPAAVELRKFLESAPNRERKVRDVVRHMKRMGYSYRALYRAREVIGATFRRVGGWAEKGYVVYHLPENAKPEPSRHGNYVFLCTKCRKWTRMALTQKFKRIREVLDLPLDCRLYGVRHYFISWAVRRGLNLKAIATLVGHTTTAMVERVYCHVDNDFEFLQKSAAAALGLAGQSMPLPLPVDQESLDKLVETANYPKAPVKPKREKKARDTNKLTDAHRIAFEAFKWACSQNDSLKTDAQVFAWLRARPEYRDQLPESLETFRRYLSIARKHFIGMTRRQERRARLQKPDENGGGS